MKNVIKFTDVFYGYDTCLPPKDGTLYSRWNNFKGKAGNTQPGACLPFGNVSCNPYSGGYSSGYGNNKINGGEPISTFFDGKKLVGFSHFSHSGSGAFGFYYNYLVTVPSVSEEQHGAFTLKEITGEVARPGYYSCLFDKEQIKAEVTVCDKVALHKYKALNGEKLTITVDISNDGLWQSSRLSKKPSESKFQINADGSVSGYAVLQGVKLYFYINCLSKDKQTYLWQNTTKTTQTSLAFSEAEDKFGCGFVVNANVANLQVAFSLVSEEVAKKNAKDALSFKQAKKTALKTWQKYLSAIKIYGASKHDKQVFYSNYYHTLTKPNGWAKESFLWKEDEFFYHDFATLWDVYKTQLPLVFMLYKGVSKGIVNTLIRYGNEKSGLFNALMLSANRNIESQQACCLGAYVLYDAYLRGMVDDVDGLLTAVQLEIERYKEDYLKNSLSSVTKILDIAWIAQSYAELCKKLGKTDYEEYFNSLVNGWQKVFGEDGLLTENSSYYEGNRWNYSFRLTPLAKERIALCGKDKIEKYLDGFFALTDDNIMGDRFEGFNNETDMETPYFYNYVGARDKLKTVLDECFNECFTTGPNGAPGNNDSGGLSACYMWNFLGLFPATGQDQIMLGFPRAKKSVINLYNGNKLVIKKVGNGSDLKCVMLNGKAVQNYAVSVTEVMAGGTLNFIYE